MCVCVCLSKGMFIFVARKLALFRFFEPEQLVQARAVVILRLPRVEARRLATLSKENIHTSVSGRVSGYPDPIQRKKKGSNVGVCNLRSGECAL